MASRSLGSGATSMTAIHLVSGVLGEADGEAADGVEVCPGPGILTAGGQRQGDTERDQHRVQRGPPRHGVTTQLFDV